MMRQMPQEIKGRKVIFLELPLRGNVPRLSTEHAASLGIGLKCLKGLGCPSGKSWVAGLHVNHLAQRERIKTWLAVFQFYLGPNNRIISGVGDTVHQKHHGVTTPLYSCLIGAALFHQCRSLHQGVDGFPHFSRSAALIVGPFSKCLRYSSSSEHAKDA